MPPALTIGLDFRDVLQSRVIKDLLSADGYHCATRADSGFATAELRLTDQDRAEAAASTILIRVAEFGPGGDGGARDRIRLGHVLANVRRTLDRDGMAATGRIEFSHFIMDLSQLTLDETSEGNGRTIVLTEKERDILMRLHLEHGRTLDRRTLLEDVWGYAAAVETHTLETHIYRLRQKLEADPANPRILTTEGTGYRLAP